MCLKGLDAFLAADIAKKAVQRTPRRGIEKVPFRPSENRNGSVVLPGGSERGRVAGTTLVLMLTLAVATRTCLVDSLVQFV